jgi:hypothetical protein
MPAGRPPAVPPSMHVPQCRRDKQLREEVRRAAGTQHVELYISPLAATSPVKHVRLAHRRVNLFARGARAEVELTTSCGKQY